MLEEKSEENLVPTKQRRGIYLLPNLFTTFSLFMAFDAIISAMRGHYTTAVVAVFIGMIADALDGRVARLTNTQTAFGAEYDSLADMVTSGVAPAVIGYSAILQNLGKFGWLVAFIYTACVALRLARFNTQLGVANKKYFQGLSCPSAAGVTISFVWFASHYHLSLINWAVPFGILMLLVSCLMVSNVRYYSFKDLDFKGRVPFVSIFIFVLLLGAVAINPSLVLLISFLIYAIAGPVQTLWMRRKIKHKDAP